MNQQQEFFKSQQLKYNPQLQKFGVEIVVDNDKGRSIVATKDLTPGNVVMVEAPFAFSLHSDQLHKRCASCFNLIDKQPMACANCQKTRYCSNGCQRLDWQRGHSKECKTVFQSVESESVATTADTILLGRVLRKQNQAKASQNSCDQQANDVLEVVPLQSDADDVAHLHAHFTEQSERAESNAKLLDKAKNHFKQARQAEQNDLMNLLCQFQANNFGIDDELLNVLGSGVYPLGALLNHSCQFNCIHSYVFDKIRGPLQVWRVLKPIKKGDELTHSYVDVGMTLEKRRSILKNMYGFECNCDECKMGIDGPREKFKNADKEGKQLPLNETDQQENNDNTKDTTDNNKNDDDNDKSDELEKQRDKDLQTAARLQQQAELQFDNDKQELTLLRTALTLRMKWLHPLNAQIVATHSQLASTALVVGNFTIALQSYRALVAAFKAYYPRHHPIISVNQSILGEVEGTLGNLQSALIHLAEAYESFLISRGPRAEVTNTLLKRVLELKSGLKTN